MRIVLTRESGHNGRLRSLTPTSATVYEVPLTTTKYRSLTLVQRELQSSSYYRAFNGLVVTSARSGDYVETALRACRRDVPVYSVGRETTRMLKSHDVGVTAEALSGSGELATLIYRGPVLVIGAVLMHDELSVTLRERGLSVTHVACYETLGVEVGDRESDILRLADVVFIGAPSAWRSAKDFVSPKAWVVVPGTTTGDAVRVDHQRVIEGWDETLRDVLLTLAN